MEESAKKPSVSTVYKIFPLTLAIFLIIFAYAFVRYNLLKAVDLQYVPMYVTNKVLALSAVVFIAMSYVLGPLRVFDKKLFTSKLVYRRCLGQIGYGCAVIHTMISMMLLTPYYYPGLYAAGRFTFFGQLHLLSGVLSMVIFTIVAVSSLPGIMQSIQSDLWHRIQRSGYIAFAFVLVHVYTLGVGGWADKTTWPGGLLPISLIAFNIILFVMLVKIASLIASGRISENSASEVKTDTI